MSRLLRPLPPAAPHAAPVPRRADLIHLLDRARRAFEGLARGGHAAAERVLRETAAAIARRGEPALACVVHTWLGRLLIERGRPADALGVLDGNGASKAGAASAEAQAWRAWALADLTQLGAAESVCLDVLRDERLDSGPRPVWARAVLSRVYVAQGRLEESLALDLALPAKDEHALPTRPAAPALPARGVDAVTAVLVETIDVRRLLAAGHVFDAAMRLAAGGDECARADAVATRAGAGDFPPHGPWVHAIRAVSELRVRGAAGDMTRAEEVFARALRLTADAGLPLWSLRALLTWASTLARAGRRDEALRLIARARRRAPSAPPLLRRSVEAVAREIERAGHAVRAAGRAGAGGPGFSRRFVEVLVAAVDGPSSRSAIESVLQQAAVELGATSLAVVALDGTVLAAHHDAAAPAMPFRTRAAHDGAVTFEGAGEMAVPVRHASLLVGVLPARLAAGTAWTAARQEMLELTACALAPVVADVTEAARLRGSVEDAVPSMVGRGAAMTAVREAIARAARAPFAVLIEGESGAGKELVARAIHSASARQASAFCDVNCAALPDELLESELFGHAKGAFTGATADRPGLFEHASGGTVFLDEVADLSPRAQAKLLRVLQQQEVRRVGETVSRRVDVRVISAANRDMHETAAAGRFRDDLLYRLDVIRIRVPPLRERPEDVAALAAHVWASASASVGTRARLSPAIIDALTRYAWPGNVRELQNVLAALAAAAPARGHVPLRLLPERVAAGAAGVVPSPRLDEARDAFERAFVEAALARAGGGRTRAALALGLSRQGLAKVMRRLGFPTAPARRV